MRLYINQRVFSWIDRFSVMDEQGRDKYFVEGEFFSWGKKLHVYDTVGHEVAFIKQELLSFMPRFSVFRGDCCVGQIRKKFTFFFPQYVVEGLDWEIEGSFMAHDYFINRMGKRIASIQKRWMTWGDNYEIDIANPADEIVALAVVLAIDCVMDSGSNVNTANH